jgi:Lysyl oxidase
VHRFVIALFCLVLAAVWVGTGLAQDQAPERLPDLDEETPSQLSVRAVRVRGGMRFRLGFRSGAANIGKGPLFIKARRSVRDPLRLKAEQVVALANGKTTTYPGMGKLRYARFKDHEHWHWLGYSRYELRRANGKLARPALKQGFCLADSYRRKGIPDPPERIYDIGHRDTDCGKRRPRATYVEEGVSVGWGDDYEPHLEGQQIDVTGLRAGVYVMVHLVNPERTLRERSYRNNAASLRFRLSWPNGRGSLPVVTRIRGCARRAWCPQR